MKPKYLYLYLYTLLSFELTNYCLHSYILQNLSSNTDWQPMESPNIVAYVLLLYYLLVSHLVPDHPGSQLHAPFTGEHVPLPPQLHSIRHSSPHRPCGQTIEHGCMIGYDERIHQHVIGYTGQLGNRLYSNARSNLVQEIVILGVCCESNPAQVHH